MIEDRTREFSRRTTGTAYDDEAEAQEPWRAEEEETGDKAAVMAAVVITKCRKQKRRVERARMREKQDQGKLKKKERTPKERTPNKSGGWMV